MTLPSDREQRHSLDEVGRRRKLEVARMNARINKIEPGRNNSASVVYLPEP